jgi:hypothetical protein
VPVERGDRGPSQGAKVEGIGAKGGKVLPGKEEPEPGMVSRDSCAIHECANLSMATERGGMDASNGLVAAVGESNEDAR